MDEMDINIIQFTETVKNIDYTIVDIFNNEVNINEYNSDAWFGLGFCYLQGGDGVEKNYKLAIECFTKAINVDEYDSTSQKYLGKCYYEGKGVKKNRELAYYWYSKAIVQGDKSAIKVALYKF